VSSVYVTKNGSLDNLKLVLKNVILDNLNLMVYQSEFTENLE
jgi:hypothetical protein